MNWYSKLLIKASEQPCSGLDLSSFDAFMRSLKTLPREEIRRLQQEMNAVQERSFTPGPGWKKLYHGTDSSIADKIRSSGFQVGEGRRSGFMGMTKTVANQGVFLSDDASSARYFGQNRSDDPRAADLVTCYADVSKVMNFDSPPPPVRRLGLSILNKYEGTRKTRLALRDWWWLLDQPEFVSSIKEAGFSGVRFPEDPKMKLPGSTYLIFDPSSIKVVGKKGDGINNVRDFYEYLKENRHGEETAPVEYEQEAGMV